MFGEYLKSQEAANYLGVHIDTLRRWTMKGHVPCYRTITNHRRYKKSDLDDLIARGTPKPPPTPPEPWRPPTEEELFGPDGLGKQGLEDK